MGFIQEVLTSFVAIMPVTLAQSLILFLVLFPYVALRQLGAILGPGKLKQLFLGVPR